MGKSFSQQNALVRGLLCRYESGAPFFERDARQLELPACFLRFNPAF